MKIGVSLPIRELENDLDSIKQFAIMAEELGFSLGKLNYCLKALKEKGFVKINNFKKKKNKITYIQYIITPKGISERTKLTIAFMKRKMKEYDDLKKELE